MKWCLSVELFQAVLQLHSNVMTRMQAVNLQVMEQRVLNAEPKPEASAGNHRDMFLWFTLLTGLHNVPVRPTECPSNRGESDNNRKDHNISLH